MREFLFVSVGFKGERRGYELRDIGWEKVRE